VDPIPFSAAPSSHSADADRGIDGTSRGPHVAWQFSRVEAPKNFSYWGKQPLAVDAAGHPHIAYGSDFLYYAWHDGTAWRYETVDDDGPTGRNPSLALDAAGRPHIVYSAGSWPDRVLKYAWYDGSAWHVVLLEHTSSTRAAIAVDPLGRPHVAYGNDDALCYLHFDGTTWHATTVEEISSSDASLALDGAGFPHIIYLAHPGGQSYALRYACPDGTGWHVETLVTSYDGLESDLAVDSLDQPHVAYCDDSDAELIYMASDGTSWYSETVATDWSADPSLALDTTGRPHIVFWSSGLNYAVRDGGTWNSESLGIPGYWATLAVDGNDHAHVAFPYSAYLHYVHNDGPSWQEEIVDQAAHAEPYSSLAFDGQGTPYVSFFIHVQASPQYWQLKVAHYDGTAWQSEVVTTGREGAENSLALDANGYPHISYASCDYTHNECDLGYTCFDGTAWQSLIVDAAGDVGGHNALAVDAAGHPHIAYSDATQGTVKYAWYDGTAWHIEAVDGTGAGHSADTSLAVDGAGRPHIAYYDHNSGSLKYAYHDGSAWQIQMIDDSAYYVGLYNAIALDGTGSPHIAYCADWPDDALKYAYYDGAAWHVEQIAIVGCTGRTSLALDAQDRPHIAYGDQEEAAIRYVWHDGTAWQFERVTAPAIYAPSSWLALDGAGRPHISYRDFNSDILYASRPVGCVYLPQVIRQDW
jgi:hypothetical protein